MPSILKNVKLFLLFWIVGISAIGSPMLLFLCFDKGFKIAFTIAMVFLKLGWKNGYHFIFHHLFWSNIFVVLMMVILTASSFKVTYHILKEKKDIKHEIIRHSFVSFLGAFFLVTSIICEVFSAI